MKRAINIHYTEGWVGHGASLDAVEKRNISYLQRKSNSDSSVIQPIVTTPTEFYVILAFFFPSHLKKYEEHHLNVQENEPLVLNCS
jgi:hypothetical protein